MYRVTLFIVKMKLVASCNNIYPNFVFYLKAVTLVGMWLIPLYFNIKLKFWRMLSTWAVFSSLTGFIFYKSTRQPLSPTTPRQVLFFSSEVG